MALLLACAVVPAHAQYRFTKYDIAPNQHAFSRPGNFTVFKNKLYFKATTPAEGDELWCFDGVTTKLVADIYPGNFNGLAPDFTKGMVATTSDLFFTAMVPATGHELYRYDGVNPPYLYYDIAPGMPSSRPLCIAAIANKLYIICDTGNALIQLYSIDLSTNTLKRLSGTPGSQHSYVASYDYITYNNKIYYAYIDSAAGQEIGMYDPATQTNSVAFDINAGKHSSFPRNFTVMNGELYFTASANTGTRYIFRYNGVNPPVQVTQINTLNSNMVAYNNELYFTDRDYIWKTHLYSYNPSTQITTHHVDMDTVREVRDMVVYNNRLFYHADGIYMYHAGNTHTYLPLLNADIKSEEFGSLPFVYNNRLYYNGVIRHPSYDEELCELYDSALSVKEVPPGLSATLYPNPTTSDAHLDVTLQQAQTIQVRIVDMNGRTIYLLSPRIYATGQHTINLRLQNLTPGIYTYHIADKENMLLQAGKLLKQ